jgi:hypothetical protein
MLIGSASEAFDWLDSLIAPDQNRQKTQNAET